MSTTPAAVASPVKRQSLVSRATAAVASHPNIALAAISILTALVIVLLVYYRGALGFGPYNKTVGQGPAGAQVTGPAPPGGPTAAPSSGDAETERLIETINGAPG